MLSRLAEAERRYVELEKKLEDPAVVSDLAAFRETQKEYSGLAPVIAEYRRYLAAVAAAKEAEELLSSPDAELRELAAEEARASAAAAGESKKRLTEMLLPRDPNDDRGVVVELRAGAGGEEACLFAADLFRMYSMYCASCGFRISVVTANRTELGGFRKLIFTVEGDRAYSRLKFESGVHEVKRVPVTESQGRIQTSTVSVAVIPEADEVEVSVDPRDVIFESCKSSGAGGQHINKTESAVRLTHVPTGIVIECQEERSQLQNREKAMKALRAMLYDIRLRERDRAIASARRSMVGTADRSERIRIYRFQENLVCDERIKYKSPTLAAFLDGDMGGLIDALSAADAAEKLSRNPER
jgi:peptide chain release factor 1